MIHSVSRDIRPSRIVPEGRTCIFFLIVVAIIVCVQNLNSCGALYAPYGVLAGFIMYGSFLFTHCGGFRVESVRALIISGMIMSMLLTHLIHTALSAANLRPPSGSCLSTLVSALVEEFAKLLSIFFVVCYSPRPALEIRSARATDLKAFVYCAISTGFGFALMENILNFSDVRTSRGGQRMINSRICMLCGHPLFTGIASLIFAKSGQWFKSKVSRFMTALFIATIPHFTWNALAAYGTCFLLPLTREIASDALLVLFWIGLLVLIYKVKGMIDV